jgi:hypothetical protein
MADIRGVGKGFSPWLPLETKEITENGIKKWVGQFPVDEEVSLWALRKFVHWEASIDRLQAFGQQLMFAGSGASLLGGMTIPSMQIDIGAGSFEYLITDPQGKIIMWQKIHLVLNLIWMVQSVLGIMNIGFFIWNSLEDRSYHYRNRRFPTAAKNENPTLEPPIVKALKNSNQEFTGKILIRYNGRPTYNNGSEVNEMRVERALIESGNLDKADPPSLAFDEIGVMSYDTTDNFFYYEDSPERAELYIYRVTAGDSYSDGISGITFGRYRTHTFIETFVIDGMPTIDHPDLTINGSERISYADYADKVWFPRGREETLYLDPAAGGSYTDSEAIVDTWWNSPIYSFKIPRGSILTLKADYFLIPSNTDGRSRNKLWQFSYKTAPSPLWGIIRRIAGNMLHAQATSDGVSIVSAEKYDETSKIATNKVLLTFEGKYGAFLYETPHGYVYCGLVTNKGTELWVSTDKGANFGPVGGKYKEEDGTRVPDPILLFDSSTTIVPIDVTQDEFGHVYILGESGANLYIEIDPEKDGENVHPIGKKQPDNLYRLIDYSDTMGQRAIKVGGNTHAFVSTNGGINWLDLSKENDVNKLLNMLPNEEGQTTVDGFKNTVGVNIILQESQNYLYAHIKREDETKTVLIGPKKDEEVYIMEAYSSPYSENMIGVSGKTHRYVSSNGGGDWVEQQIMEE